MNPRIVAATLAAAALSLVPVALAATSDVADATADKTVVVVGEPVTFTSVDPCARACSLTWTWLNGSRLGERLGTGQSITTSFGPRALTKVSNTLAPYVRVRLDLAQTCTPTSRLVCHSYDDVYLEVRP